MQDFFEMYFGGIVIEPCNTFHLLRQVNAMAASLSGSIALEAGNLFSNPMRKLHDGHLGRQKRRLERGKPIGKERAQRAWKNMKVRTNTFRQRLLRGGK